MRQIRVVKSPISPVYRENEYQDDPNSQAIFTIKLANGLLITNSKDFFEIPESEDYEELEEISEIQEEIAE